MRGSPGIDGGERVPFVEGRPAARDKGAGIAPPCGSGKGSVLLI